MAAETTPADRGRVYKDRVGRIITDPAAIEARYVQEQIARAERRGAATVGDVAKATKLTPARLVEIVRTWNWLWGLTENDSPIETWGVWLDGE